MRRIYTLTMREMNGTVTMYTKSTSFASKELAEKVKSKLEKLNSNSIFPILYTIEESEVYENENEVPVLNNYE